MRAPQLSTGAVTTTKLKTASVTVRKVKPGAIGTTELTDGGVRTPDIGPSAVGGVQIADGSVAGAEIADGAVATADLPAGAVTEPKIAAGSVTRGKLTADAQVPITVVRRSAVIQVPIGTVGTATAACAPGERLTGGGAAPDGVAPSAVFYPAGGIPLPNGDGETPTQWQGFLVNEPTSGSAVGMVAFAICAPAG